MRTGPLGHLRNNKIESKNAPIEDFQSTVRLRVYTVLAARLNNAEYSGDNSYSIQ
jgi:hypothetical protein